MNAPSPDTRGRRRAPVLLRAAGRRLADLAFVMLLVATVSFLLLRAIPGDPLLILGGLDTLDAEGLAETRAEMGLDRPIMVQYVIWVGDAMTGDLGQSLRTGVEVTTLIGRAIWPTLQLGLMALAIGIAIAVPLGIAAARRAGSAADAGITAFAILGISTPPFVIALGLIYLFAVQLQLLPTTGYTPFLEDPVENIRGMILPALSLGLVTAGILVRILRRSVIDELGHDYVRAARAKGVTERRVVYGHATRNALIPFVTIVGIEAGILLSGTIITESIFAIPGLGRLMIEHINLRDYPVVQGAVLVVALLYVLINAGVDALYRLLDPRIRAEEAE